MRSISKRARLFSQPTLPQVPHAALYVPRLHLKPTELEVLLSSRFRSLSITRDRRCWRKWDKMRKKIGLILKLSGTGTGKSCVSLLPVPVIDLLKSRGADCHCFWWLPLPLPKRRLGSGSGSELTYNHLGGPKGGLRGVYPPWSKGVEGGFPPSDIFR